MSNGVVFVGREKEIGDFRSAVNSLEDRGRAMLVVGAAGYGKSALLREFERRCKEEKIIKGKVIVIRDEFSRSDDPLSFLSRVQEAWLKEVNPKSMKIIGGVEKYRTYLEGAIDAIATGASLLLPAGALISLMKMGFPSMQKLPQNTGFLLQAFVADLAEFGRNNPDKRLILIFDEYHKISNEDIFNAMFNDIIENLPKIKNVMLVIASRSLMLAAYVEPLRVKLFNEYETASFLKKNLGIEDKELIAKAQKKLRGYPYSLGLLMRVSKETSIEEVIENLPANDVDDYLQKEVFKTLPDNVQRFLRKVCVLHILDENICKFVMNQENYDETACSNILSQLQSLTVLDEFGKVKMLRLYRLDNLFRDFLMALNDASLPELHLRASEYYKKKIEKGRADERIDITDVRFALYHLCKSGDINAFVKLLNEYEERLRIFGYLNELLSYFNNINFEKISEDDVKSTVLHNYGVALYLTGKYNEALEKYNESLQILEKLDGQRQRRITQTLQGIAAIQRAKGNYKGALDKYEQSLKIEEKLDDQRGIATTLHEIAIILQHKGKYDEALDKYNRSLDIRKKQDDQLGIAKTLHQIAMIHQEKKEYDKAMEKYNQSLEIKKKFGHKRGIAQTLHQIAMIHQLIKEYDKAMEKYNQSLKEFKELGDQRNIAYTLHNIAKTHQDKDERDKALDKYNQSLEIAEKLDDQRFIATTYLEIGLLYIQIGKREDAIEYTQKALDIFETIDLENEAKKAKAQIETIRKSES